MEEIERLNLDYYEQVLIYKSLTDERYLAQIIDHVQPEYFNDKNIATCTESKMTYKLNNNTVTPL